MSKKNTSKDKMVAIYHRVYKRENFEKAAKDLLGLIHGAQEKEPDRPRVLYVDIDGHRNEAGGYDADMYELQTEFGMNVLLQFVKELHFPLASVANPGEQNNDVPEKLIIGNARNERDGRLEELYIENYSNTEFMSEEDVYKYMKDVSEFLADYSESAYRHYEKKEYDIVGYLGMWQNHIKELIIELFNSFVYGNLLSVAAMTRTLIECYIFVRIMKKEQSQQLMDEWWLCNMIHKIKNDGSERAEQQKRALKNIVKFAASALKKNGSTIRRGHKEKKAG